MIKLMTEKSQNGLVYKIYKSEAYKIIITYLDDKLESIELKCRKYLYPDIVCDLRDCSVSLIYDIIVKEDKRDRFKACYERATEFIDSELKPFILNLKKTGENANEELS